VTKSDQETFKVIETDCELLRDIESDRKRLIVTRSGQESLRAIETKIGSD